MIVDRESQKRQTRQRITAAAVLSAAVAVFVAAITNADKLALLFGRASPPKQEARPSSPIPPATSVSPDVKVNPKIEVSPSIKVNPDIQVSPQVTVTSPVTVTPSAPAPSAAGAIPTVSTPSATQPAATVTPLANPPSLQVPAQSPTSGNAGDSSQNAPAASSSSQSVPPPAKRDSGRVSARSTDRLGQLARLERGNYRLLLQHLQRLGVGMFGDGVLYLRRSLAWRQGRTSALSDQIEIPRGFVFEFESVPSVLFLEPSFLKDDELVAAAIGHDYLYWNQGAPRSKVDEDFVYALRARDLPPTLVKIVEQALRSAGGSVWSENADLRRKGEQRLLTRFPVDPDIGWEEWKLEPGVLRR